MLRVLWCRRRAYCTFNSSIDVTTSQIAQKATPSLVIAQSYQMGPSSKVDPLTMLNEAKRVCDQLVRSNLPTSSFLMDIMYPASKSQSARRSTSATRLSFCGLSSAAPSIDIRSSSDKLSAICCHYEPFNVRHASRYSWCFTAHVSGNVHHDPVALPDCAVLSISPRTRLLSPHAQSAARRTCVILVCSSHDPFCHLFCGGYPYSNHGRQQSRWSVGGLGR
jgi:hypothetical protein